MTEQEIVVTEYRKPWTWYVATFDGDDRLDCTYGSGRTPLDAIVDLLDQAED